jgi:hypothetical protein
MLMCLSQRHKESEKNSVLAALREKTLARKDAEAQSTVEKKLRLRGFA